MLDTNVVSQATKPQPAPGVVAFLRTIPLPRLYISSITLGELEFGTEDLTDPSKRARLRLWLDDILRPDYQGRILTPDDGVMTTWARMILASGRRPKQVPCMDALLAATALHHDLTMVTRNVGDFQGFGVRVFNPWDEPLPM
ncbi:type II toxin-antitoxin system VapC family toxin [Deinococcus planocerae]|uniref:type II toxin-antitoxin system VapC family toxin n=1 Tax=Deinococcus planocerae TaxID=1737569 RepID=UPI001C6412C4|nr:type II toxin-antitoxin system VapC family toxin [Deinococcus planocerae]